VAISDAFKRERWRLGVPIAIIVVFVLAIGLWLASAGPPDAPLLRGLKSTDYAGMNAEFDERVKTRYPLGSEESAVIADLEKQGFTRSGYDYNESRRWRYLTYRSWYCEIHAIVAWQAFPPPLSDGRLREVKGSFKFECL